MAKWIPLSSRPGIGRSRGRVAPAPGRRHSAHCGHPAMGIARFANIPAAVGGHGQFIDLDDVQGTVLRGYRVNLSRHFVLSIVDAGSARALIAKLVDGLLDPHTQSGADLFRRAQVTRHRRGRDRRAPRNILQCRHTASRSLQALALWLFRILHNALLLQNHVIPGKSQCISTSLPNKGVDIALH